MPKGPQGQKRPADVIGCAVAVAKIATGEAKEALTDPPKRQPNKAKARSRWGQSAGRGPYAGAP